MTPTPDLPPPLDWNEAAKLTPAFGRWLATFSFCCTVLAFGHLVWQGNTGMSIGPIRLDLFDALCLFGCLLLASGPVWVHTWRRVARYQAPAPALRRIGASAGLLLLGLLITPTFVIQHHDYQRENDVRTKWIKRSLFETLAQPRLDHDELDWLQSNYSASYIPAEVYCARVTTRLYPLFGRQRDDHLANALAASRDRATDDGPPPAEDLAAGIARCRIEGPAMRANGLTKESALVRGDLDTFFARALLETDPNGAVVLEDDDLPADLRARINAFLASQGTEQGDYLHHAMYELTPSTRRRINVLAVAAATGRAADAAAVLAPR